MTSKVAISQIPEGYGRLKRLSFNLGMIAYRRPLTRRLYDLSADLGSLPALVFNPYYDLEGIRHNVAVCSGMERGELANFSSQKLLSEAEIKRVFHPILRRGSADPRLVKSAFVNLDRILNRRAGNFFTTMLSAASLFSFGLYAWLSFKDDAPLYETVFYAATAVASARYWLESAAKGDRMFETLVNFLVGMDRQTLIDSLPQIVVHRRTRDMVENVFWKRREETDALFHAFDRMPLIEEIDR